MGIFDFFKKSESNQKSSRSLKLSESEISEMQKKYALIVPIWAKSRTVLADWELENNGDMYSQINFLCKEFGIYLESAEMLSTPAMVYLSIYIHKTKEYRDKFSNEEEMEAAWWGKKFDTDLQMIYFAFYNFESELAKWGIKHNSSVWKNNDGEVVKESMGFDPFVISKLKNIITQLLILMKDSHKLVMDGYRYFSDKGLLPNEERGKYWNHKHLEDPIYLGGNGARESFT